MNKSRFLFNVVVGLFVSSAHLTPIQAQSVSLAWDASPSPGIASYIVRYGTASGVYSLATNVGNRTTAIISGLQTGRSYYLAVTARDAAGIESLPSNEVSYQVPTIPTPPPQITLNAPLANASFQSPATINCAAGVIANGHTIAKVQFYSGSTLLGEDASSPYSFAWSGVVAGSYAVKARVIYDSGSTVDSALASITVNGLAAPWQTRDIGTVGLPGSGSQSNRVYSVRGAGKMAGTTDSFRFVYQTLSADGEIKAQLTSVQSNNTGSSFGVMIRENLTTGSRYAYMGVSQDLKFRWQRRSSTGGSTSSITSTQSTLPNTWVRLVRSGSTITGYKSTDGATWTKVSSRNISMAANVCAGFVVASGSANVLNTATFANAVVVP